VPVGLIVLAATAGWSVSERWFGLQQAIQVQVSAINVRLAVMEQRLDELQKQLSPHEELPR
jgi:uncharacterized membrane protein